MTQRGAEGDAAQSRTVRLLSDHGETGLHLAGGERLAVYIAVCLEHFSYGEGGLGLSYSPGIPHPNTYNWAWREYGNRVGGWRLLALLQQHGIPPTVC